MILKSVSYLLLLTIISYTKSNPTSSFNFDNDIIKLGESPLNSKSFKNDWKISSTHEKHINRHSWVLIPQNEHLHRRFRRTVPYDDKTFPYKDVGNNNNSKEKKKNNNNTSNPINNNSTHKAAPKKKKYHRLAHSVHVQSDIRYR